MSVARLMRGYRELRVHRILVRYLRESLLEGNPIGVADRLIASCRLFKPEALDGHGYVDGYGYAQREPHRLVSAVMVLERGFDLYKDESEIRAGILVALGKLFEVTLSGQHRFSEQDCARMTAAMQSFHEEDDSRKSQMDKWNKR